MLVLGQRESLLMSIRMGARPTQSRSQKVGCWVRARGQGRMDQAEDPGFCNKAVPTVKRRDIPLTLSPIHRRVDEGPWCPQTFGQGWQLTEFFLDKETCMALIYLLLWLGTGVLGSQGILVGEQNPSNSISSTKAGDQSSALPFLERRTGAVGHHGGGGTTCVVKGSYCQVLRRMNFYK